MGNIIRNGIEYSGGGASSAEDVTFDGIEIGLGQNVDEAIRTLNNNFTDLITTTISAGDTSATITDASITTDSIVDVYFKNKILAPTSLTVSAGKIEIEIDAEDTDTEIGIRII